MANSVDVAVGIIKNPQREVLITLRAKESLQGNLWEFPGGKVEVGETDYQALCRELKEEIGITVLKAEPWLQLDHDYGEYPVKLFIWNVLKFDGTPQGLEKQPLQWIAIQDLVKLPFPTANQSIIDYLMKSM